MADILLENPRSASPQAQVRRLVRPLEAGQHRVLSRSGPAGQPGGHHDLQLGAQGVPVGADAPQLLQQLRGQAVVPVRQDAGEQGGAEKPVGRGHVGPGAQAHDVISCLVQAEVHPGDGLFKNGLAVGDLALDILPAPAALPGLQDDQRDLELFCQVLPAIRAQALPAADAVLRVEE